MAPSCAAYKGDKISSLKADLKSWRNNNNIDTLEKTNVSHFNVDVMAKVAVLCRTRWTQSEIPG